MNEFLFTIYQFLLQIKLNIVPKLCLWFVYDLIIFSGVTHWPHNGGYIFDGKLTSMETTLYDSLYFFMNISERVVKLLGDCE